MPQPIFSRANLMQAAVLLAAAAMLLGVGTTTAENLKRLGIPLGFDFLAYPARFIVSETLLPYSPLDPYWRAIAAGLVNTLFISALVIAFSSVLGLLVGIGRLSGNPLAAAGCRVWVEAARNTPPLLLLIFLYSLWWKALPQVTQAWALLPGVHLSVRGLVMPSLLLGMSAGLLCILAAVAATAVLVARLLGSRTRRRTGRQPPYAFTAACLLAGAALAAGWLAGVHPVVDWPVFDRSNFRGGMELTPELTTIVVGLTLYTTGFVAEIVRSGIQAVARGQWEAGKAVGLSRGQVLRLIVIPQALRVIVPPLTSQCINVVKNSTLAIAVGYPEFMTVMGTVINKSSHAIEGVLLILGAYLVINLGLAACLGWVNRRFALIER